MSVITAATDISYGAHPRQRIDLFVPQDCDGLPLCCILPTSWEQGERAELRTMALNLAEHGVPTCAIGHRPLSAKAAVSELLGDLRVALGSALDEAHCLGAAVAGPVLLGHGINGPLMVHAAAELMDDEARAPGGLVLLHADMQAPRLSDRPLPSGDSLPNTLILHAKDATISSASDWRAAGAPVVEHTIQASLDEVVTQAHLPRGRGALDHIARWLRR